MMRLYRYEFQPGETRTINATGSFLRGMAAKWRYQVQFDSGAATDFETGIAYQSAQPFSAVRVTNTADEAQIIEVAVADGYIADNRLVGRMDVDGLIRTQIDGGVSVTGGQLDVIGRIAAPASAIVHPVQTIAAATEVLGVNALRKSAVVQCAGYVYVGSAADGIQVQEFTWDVQDALTLVPVGSDVEVRILEEVYQ